MVRPEIMIARIVRNVLLEEKCFYASSIFLDELWQDQKYEDDHPCSLNKNCHICKMRRRLNNVLRLIRIWERAYCIVPEQQKTLFLTYSEAGIVIVSRQFDRLESVPSAHFNPLCLDSDVEAFWESNKGWLEELRQMGAKDGLDEKSWEEVLTLMTTLWFNRQKKQERGKPDNLATLNDIQRFLIQKAKGEK